MKKLTVKDPQGLPLQRFPGRRRIRGRHIFLLLVLVGIGFFVYGKIFPPGEVAHEKITKESSTGPVKVEAIPEMPPATPKVETTNDRFEIRHHLVQEGDTLTEILRASGIPEEHAGDWEKACKTVPLNGIQTDDELIFFLTRNDGPLVKVIYSQSQGKTYSLRKTSTAWECSRPESVQGMPVRTVLGRYSENFYDSCIAGGLPASLITILADIFSYDVDFNTDLKDEDTFAVHFQEQPFESSEGKQFLILAAAMTISGKTYYAFGFQLPDGSWDYFDAKGASLRRAFLRSPISYRRLISPSSYKNVKPVLKIYRPYMGIDYAAPRGTPVSAIGDGVISAVKKSGKTGLSIDIRHRGGFKSSYGNLSGISRGLKLGSLVSQGEVIGSIGSSKSGKSYLDFDFFRNGKPVNFQTIEYARSKTIPKAMMAEFEKLRESYSAALNRPEGQKQEMLSGRD
ncbi:MAG: peptidoglycan DD-metalloendopeptidase family protein [Syntrophobacteraceae bacterium]